MSNIVIHADQETAPLTRTRAMACLTDQTFSRLEHVPGRGPATFEISDRFAPTASERAELASRHAFLAEKMRPAVQDEISTWVRRLLAGWGGVSRSREEAAA